jgi:hypothetical protein
VPPLPKFHSLFPRLLYCLITGIAVTVTSFICAWYNFRSFANLRSRAFGTQSNLEFLAKEIASYRQQTGHLPASLGDLEAVKKMTVLIDNGRPLDRWHRPLHYEVKGESYELYSLGRDGKPGGVGVDADLHAGRWDEFADERHWLTFWQFLNAPETDRMRLICIGAGILVFPIWLHGVTKVPRERVSRRDDILMDLAGHAVTAIFAIGTAVVISGLHMPSGH